LTQMRRINVSTIMTAHSTLSFNLKKRLFATIKLNWLHYNKKKPATKALKLTVCQYQTV
jgi:hypothetical protein